MSFCNKVILTSIVCVFAFNANISYSSINSFHSTTPLFYIPFEMPSEEINTLDAPKFSINKKETKIINSNSKGSQIVLSKKRLEFFHNISKSVFQTKSEQSGSGEASYSSTGSAFHIGESIIATNHHVVYPGAGSGSCSNFSLSYRYKRIKRNGKTTIENKKVTCSKIVYCNEFEDICFIKMNNFTLNGKEYQLSDLSPTLNFVDEVNKENTDFIGSSTRKTSFNPGVEYFSVNNSNDYGIQGSAGKTAYYYEQTRGFRRKCECIKKEKRRENCYKLKAKHTTRTILFHASAFPGASGSPALNTHGEVIGITRAINKESVYNQSVTTQAVPTNKIIQILQDNKQNKLLDIIL